MSEWTDEVVDVARTVIAIARDDSITFMAAAVAYYGFVSIAPLLLLAVVAATTIGGEAFAEEVISILQQFLTETAQASVRQLLQVDVSTGGVTVLSLGTLLWSALKVFRGLDQAFSAIYETEGSDGFLQNIRDAVLALSTIAIAVILAATVSVVLQGTAGPVAAIGGILLVPGTLVAAFLPLYYVFPDADLTVQEVLPGAITAGIGWWLLAWLFGVYTGLSGAASLYGVLGAALLLSTWLYFGSILVILGAAVNAAFSEHRVPEREDSSAGEDLAGD